MQLVDDLEPVGEAERAGVLELRGTLVSFRHELARRAVEGSLTSIERIELNRVMLRLLRRRGRQRERTRSGCCTTRSAPATTPRWSSTAPVRRGRRRGSAPTARPPSPTSRCSRAATCSTPPPGAASGRAYAWSLSNTNRLDAAAAEAAAAVREYESAGDRARLVRPLVTLSRQQWLTERTADSRVSAERALAVSTEESSNEALAEVNLGGLLVLVDEEEAGLPHLEAGLAIAERSGVDDIVALSRNYIGSAHLQLGDAGR